MTKEEVFASLDALSLKGSVYGTERVEALLDKIGSPDKKLNIVHVAGTNGKGSTATMIASILKEAGYKVGLFTSPAVFDRRECYLINGNYASDEAIERAFSFVLKKATDTTAFETEFVSALALFEQEGCTWAVVECGCGGLTDATNAIRKKELAVISSVSLDHTALLGSTLFEIAGQKVGIVKDCPLVTGIQEEEVMQAFLPYSPIVAKEYEGELKLKGDFQKYNAGIAYLAAKQLKIEPKIIEKGLKNATILGRNEHILTPFGTVILDGAHNEDAAKKLAFSLKKEGFHGTIFIGMFRDKAVEKVLSILLPLAKKVVLLAAPLPRGMGVEELKNIAQSYCDDVKIGTDEIIKQSLSEVGDKVVCGSFSILSEMRRCIDGQNKSRKSS